MGLREPYVRALISELERRGREWGHPQIHTVFIGGGTPSLLQPEQMARVLGALRGAFALKRDAEISCEANPGALTRRFLDTLREGGVNRLSLGAQSADGGLLRLLGRQHGWPQVEQAVRLARSCGFDNLNIDLMLGLPGQTPALWRETLQAALALSPEHLSCYGLIVEEGTPLRQRLDAGELRLPDEDEERLMYDEAIGRLSRAGLEQYEISNFARPGRACRHNLNCWLREDYLGFGSAAHTLQGGDTRLSNPSDIGAYLRGEAPARQTIGQRERMFESVMLGLRLRQGLSLARFERTYAQSFESVFGGAARRSVQNGLSEYTRDGFFRLTRAGMDVMNSVLLDFMPEDSLS